MRIYCLFCYVFILQFSHFLSFLFTFEEEKGVSRVQNALLLLKLPNKTILFLFYRRTSTNTHKHSMPRIVVEKKKNEKKEESFQFILCYIKLFYRESFYNLIIAELTTKQKKKILSSFIFQCLLLPHSVYCSEGKKTTL